MTTQLRTLLHALTLLSLSTAGFLCGMLLHPVFVRAPVNLTFEDRWSPVQEMMIANERQPPIAIKTPRYTVEATAWPLPLSPSVANWASCSDEPKEQSRD